MFLCEEDLIKEPVLTSTQSVDEARAVFSKVPYFSLPVQDPEGKYLGMICVRVLLFSAEELRASGDISTGITILKAQPMSARLERIDLAIYNDVVPIVDEEDRLLGFMRSKIINRKTKRYYRQIAELERKLLDASHNGIMAINQEGKVIVYNPAAERIIGRSRGEVIGRHIAELDPNMESWMQSTK